jgi:hypothetical protein
MRHLSLLLLAACASTPPPRPVARPAPGSRGMRADGHLDAARSHEERAAELARWPTMQRDAVGFDDPASGLWYRTWDTTRDEHEAAQHHLAEAARLHADYEQACANVPSEQVSVSPLVRYGTGGMATPHGATVILSPEAGAPEHLLDALRCHRAWMMLGEAGMDECPLDLAGLHVAAYGNATGVSVELTIDDPKLIPELQRRAAKDLEHAMARPMQ